MNTPPINLVYSDLPNGSQITVERISADTVVFVIHPTGWLFGRHSLRRWFRLKIPRIALAVALTGAIFLPPAPVATRIAARIRDLAPMDRFRRRISVRDASGIPGGLGDPSDRREN
jgi:hypothetical protein